MMGEAANLYGSQMAGTSPVIFGDQAQPSMASTSAPAGQATGSLGNMDAAPAPVTQSTTVPPAQQQTMGTSAPVGQAGGTLASQPMQSPVPSSGQVGNGPVSGLSFGGQAPSMAAAPAPAGGQGTTNNPMQTLMQAYGQMTPLDAEQLFPFFGL